MLRPFILPASRIVVEKNPHPPLEERDEVAQVLLAHRPLQFVGHEREARCQACPPLRVLSGFDAMNATNLAPGSAAAAAAENLKEFTRESVRHFSALCQEFFDRERREMLEQSPSGAALEAHRTAIKWLL